MIWAIRNRWEGGGWLEASDSRQEEVHVNVLRPAWQLIDSFRQNRMDLARNMADARMQTKSYGMIKHLKVEIKEDSRK